MSLSFSEPSLSRLQKKHQLYGHRACYGLMWAKGLHFFYWKVRLYTCVHFLCLETWLKGRGEDYPLTSATALGGAGSWWDEAGHQGVADVVQVEVSTVTRAPIWTALVHTAPPPTTWSLPPPSQPQPESSATPESNVEPEPPSVL